MLFSLLMIFAAVVTAAYGDPDARALIELAFRGRRAARRTLIRRLLPVVQARVQYYFARRGASTLDGHDAQDLAQQVWVRLLADDGALLRAYDPSRGTSLEGYVGMLVRRELWVAGKRANTVKRGSGARGEELDEQRTGGGLEDPEHKALERDLLDQVWRHLESALPPRGRLVLRLVYEDEVAPPEAATLMGVKLQVIYNWQHKIRKLAREWRAAQAG